MRLSNIFFSGNLRGKLFIRGQWKFSAFKTLEMLRKEASQKDVLRNVFLNSLLHKAIEMVRVGE